MDATEQPVKARMPPHEEARIRWILGENESLVDEEPCVKLYEARNSCRVLSRAAGKPGEGCLQDAFSRIISLNF